MGRALLVLLLAALWVPVAPAAAQPASQEQVAAAIVRPAVVSVRIRWHGWVRDKRTGEIFGGGAGYVRNSSCSGAVVHEDGYVVTAGHCVDPGLGGGARGLIEHAVAELGQLGRVRDPRKAVAELAEHAAVEGSQPDTPIERQVWIERLVATPQPSTRDLAPATVLDFLPHTKGDVALLRIPRDRLPAIEVLAGNDLPSGTPILAVGYPGSADATSDPTLEPSGKDGQISNRRTLEGVPFYEISAAATQGMSGGPVVDMQGRIIGLVSAAPAGETQAFNLVAASSLIGDTLRRMHIEPALTANDRNYRAGLERFFDGQYRDATAYFDAVLAATPWHQQATDYRRQATGRPNSAWDPTTLYLILIPICAVMGLLALVFALHTRRPRPAPEIPLPAHEIPVPADEITVRTGDNSLPADDITVRESTVPLGGHERQQ